MFKKSYRFGFIKHTSTGNKTATYEVSMTQHIVYGIIEKYLVMNFLRVSI